MNSLKDYLHILCFEEKRPRIIDKHTTGKLISLLVTFPSLFFWLVFKQAMKIITAIMTVATIAAEAGIMI